MNKGLIIVNVLLVVAVSYLLYKQFSTRPGNGITAADTLKERDSLLHKKILFAYINTDSIAQKYEFAKRVKEEVERRDAATTAELDRMQKDFTAKIEKYQKQGPAMTEEQANAARQDVEATQRMMLEKKQALEEEHRQFVTSKNMSVIKDIQDYLKKFNADGTYSFIFSYDPGLFYYQDTAYDITSEVLKGLNEEFKLRRK